MPQKSLMACVEDDASACEALEGLLTASGFALMYSRPLKSFCNLIGWTKCRV